MKRLLPFFLALALFLSGCGETQTDLRKPLPSPTETVNTPVPSVKMAEPTPVETAEPIEELKVRLTPEDRSLTDWQQAYISLIGAQEWGTHYAFHDLDGDNIPELFLRQKTGGYDDPVDIEVYTYSEGTAHSTGHFQVPYLYSDDTFYICPDRTALLCEVEEDGIITGRGGNWVTLINGELKVEPALDETIPFVEREEGLSPVLDGRELPIHNVWWGEADPMPLPLPLLNALPQVPTVATEEERTVGEAQLEAVLENKKMLYAVSGWLNEASSMWMYLRDYYVSAQINGYYIMPEKLHEREIIAQDLNGDGINERILFLEEGPDQFDAHRTVVLSYQEGVVYAYPMGSGRYQVDETGTFWVDGSDLVGEQLYFGRDQFYTVKTSIPKPKLLYRTTSEVDTTEGIRRTTLDAQGLDLSVWFETPIFPERTKGYHKINAFFENLEKEFFSPQNESLVSAWGYSIPPCGGGHKYEWTAFVTEQTDKLVSVHLWRYWFMGGVNDMGGEAYTFRTDTGERLSITDLAQGTEGEIRSAILEAFEKYEYFYEPEKVLAEAREYPLEEFTFYLTPEGFMIHLARYELGRIGAESDTTILVDGLKLQSRWQD